MCRLIPLILRRHACCSCLSETRHRRRRSSRNKKALRGCMRAHVCTHTHTHAHARNTVARKRAHTIRIRCMYDARGVSRDDVVPRIKARILSAQFRRSSSIASLKFGNFQKSKDAVERFFVSRCLTAFFLSLITRTHLTYYHSPGRLSITFIHYNKVPCMRFIIR